MLKGSQVAQRPNSKLPVMGLTRQYSDTDIKEFRRHGINTITQRPDGSLHFAPGGGVTAAKEGINSVRVSRAVDDVILRCEQLESEVKQGLEKQTTKGESVVFKLKLIEDGEKWSVYDESGQRVSSWLAFVRNL